MNHNRIFSISSPAEFEKVALDIFRYQYLSNPTYHKFCDLLGAGPDKVEKLTDIPFIPISFFKSHQIISGEKNYEQVFTSSGTTGTTTSKHYVTNLNLYSNSYLKAFELFYGPVEEYVVLALLPSYLEREGSSLIYMARDLIERSGRTESGFYLDDLDKLKNILISLDNSGQKILLIGVSFALLDLVEKHRFQLNNTIVMETGGMKGRRKEMIREELHQILQEGFGVSHIHSEYGMTELLSQAYSKGLGVFECPPWMKILIRDTEDALSYLPEGKTGGINVIDLANLNSCAFIATQDLGKITSTGLTEILGRFDNSDLRGCNLMVI